MGADPNVVPKLTVWKLLLVVLNVEVPSFSLPTGSTAAYQLIVSEAWTPSQALGSSSILAINPDAVTSLISTFAVSGPFSVSISAKTLGTDRNDTPNGTLTQL